MAPITTYQQLRNFDHSLMADTQVTGELARRICLLAEVDPDSTVQVRRHYQRFQLNGGVYVRADHRIKVGWRDMGLDGILEQLATPDA